jgi:Resolvase, N terminal domain
MTRVAIYSRVSTKEQSEGYSIADQVRELTRYAESNGYQIVQTLTDEGYSATDLNRLGYCGLWNLPRRAKLTLSWRRSAIDFSGPVSIGCYLNRICRIWAFGWSR